MRNSQVTTWAAIALLLMIGAALLLAGTTWATPGSGVTPETIAGGDLPEVVRAKFKDSHGGFERGFDVSRVQLVRFTVAPGGYFGWHQHGGPVIVAIAAGELTFYDADDASCTPQRYPAGSGFFETGEHTHTARNEGDAEVVVYATFMLPAGAPVRIDAADPGVCGF
jgi:quercetin dioxygenase-like cupin family protein